MKCEQGDLAKIIRSMRQSNLGKTVLVEQYIGYFNQGEQFDFRGIPCVSPITDHYWWISSEHGLKNFLGDTPKAYIADSWLEPIRSSQQTKSKKETVPQKERSLS